MNKKENIENYEYLLNYVDNTTFEENKNWSSFVYRDMITTIDPTTANTNTNTNTVFKFDCSEKDTHKTITLILRAVAGLLGEVNELNKKLDKLLDNM